MAAIVQISVLLAVTLMFFVSTECRSYYSRYPTYNWYRAMRWCTHRGSQLLVGDFNGDGRADMLCHDRLGRKWISFANSKGQFTGTSWFKPMGWCRHGGSQLFLGDFNGDGRTDMLCHDSKGNKWVSLANRGGTFTGTSWHKKMGWCSHRGGRLMIGDFNGDGRSDMLCYDKGRKWISLAQRGGKFVRTSSYLRSNWCGHHGSSIHIADFNGDLRDDLLCHDNKGRRWVSLTSSYGRLTGRTNWHSNKAWCKRARVHVGYLNGDRRADMLCHRKSPRGYMWISTATRRVRQLFPGTVWHSTLRWCGRGRTLYVADFNNDGKQDLLCHERRTGKKWIAYNLYPGRAPCSPNPCRNRGKCVATRRTKSGYICQGVSVPVNGGWSNWGDWGGCSVTCGGGRQTRQRSCNNPPPSRGGKPCPGSNSQRRKCATNKCPGPVNGGWSNWGAWGGCSVTCGGGYQTRQRSCNNPPPSRGGKPCPGSNSQTRKCATNKCLGPVNGGWSNWGAWGGCSATCGGGYQTRQRSCNNPPPSRGGKPCPGSNSERRNCATNSCPVNGGWSNWGAWGSCSVTCGKGQQTRRRGCNKPPPSGGGKPCPGSNSHTRDCNTRPCPVACTPGQHVYDKCKQRCLCSPSGKLIQCTRIRRELKAMTQADRTLLVNTIKTASSRSDYRALMQLHKDRFGSVIHRKEQFLPWHRYFILQYENILRKVDCRVTVAYWDWSEQGAWNTGAQDVWNDGPGGFGGNGNGLDRCVKNGPFRDSIWRPVPPGTACLRRSFSGTPPTAENVAELLNLPPNEFHRYELLLRIRYHDNVHCLIGETMCSSDAASAPEFFLHHGYVDKIWEDWQKKSSTHRQVFFTGVNGNMVATNLPASRLLYSNNLPGGVRVEYVGTPAERKMESKLRRMSIFQLRSRPVIHVSSPLRQAAIKLFGTSQKDVEKVKEAENQIMRPLRDPVYG